MISLSQAHTCIRMLEPLQPRDVPLDRALGLVCAADVYAVNDCPTVDSSLKDGFAVVSSDIADASQSNPVALSISGSLTAGDNIEQLQVLTGTAVRIMTGAAIPPGATSVLTSEFTQIAGGLVSIKADSRAGLNVLPKGSDIMQGQRVLARGDFLGPAHLGLLAAAGLKEVLCYQLPKVAIAATGSELVWPGDLMVKIFHRVRIGPGKGACMGRVGKTIVFNLPGGPPSNHVALFLLALSGVRQLMGFTNCLPPKRQVFVTEELTGQKDWTQLVYCRVTYDKGSLCAVPLSNMKRLEAMAAANALIEIPEGCAAIRKNSLAEAWFFSEKSRS